MRRGQLPVAAAAAAAAAGLVPRERPAFDAGVGHGVRVRRGDGVLWPGLSGAAGHALLERGRVPHLLVPVSAAAAAAAV